MPCLTMSLSGEAEYALAVADRERRAARVADLAGRVADIVGHAARVRRDRVDRALADMTAVD